MNLIACKFHFYIEVSILVATDTSEAIYDTLRRAALSSGSGMVTRLLEELLDPMSLSLLNKPQFIE